jgi:hypothetical protein
MRLFLSSKKNYTFGWKTMHQMTKSLICIPVFLTFLACKTVVPPNMNLLTGTVKLKEGNCMPSPDGKPCQFEDFETWVYLTEPGKEYDPSKVIDSVYTDRKGDFEMYVKNGDYSLFVKYQNEYACAGFICNPECACTPVSLRNYNINGLRIELDKSYQ